MLTGDLVRVNARGAELKPGFIDGEKAAIQERCEALVSLFNQAAEAHDERQAIDEQIGTLIGDARDHKLVRGLAKICLDRATFESSSTVDPATLRWKVFSKARDLGPIALERTTFNRPVADDILATVGSELNLSLDEVKAGLYADLSAAHRLQHIDLPSPQWLAERYNTALVQALLLKATEVTITLDNPSTPRLRQLLRYIKFHQLLHSAHLSRKKLRLTLDGPSSLFHQSTRYGLHLANFFPALLLQDCQWTFEAKVLWSKQRKERRLRLSSKNKLVSHYQDKGAYETKEQVWFRERWDALDTEWKRVEGKKPITLAGKAIVLPDFSFKKGKREAHLEIIGFWRKDYLERRIQWLSEYGPGNLILAVSRKLRGEKSKLTGFSGEVIEFAEIVPAKKVLEAVERVASPRPKHEN